jgi:hypothetical protein
MRQKAVPYTHRRRSETNQVKTVTVKTYYPFWLIFESQLLPILAIAEKLFEPSYSEFKPCVRLRTI